MNIVLSQGNVIKEIHNARKQSLEVSQQFIAQKKEDKRKEDRSKVQTFDSDNKVRINEDEKGGDNTNQRGEKRRSDGEQTENEDYFSEGNLIDIKV